MQEDNDEKKHNGDNGNDKEEKKPPKDQLVTSSHSVKIGRKKIDYTVTTGTIVLKEEGKRDEESEGYKPKAEIFFIAYTQDGVEDKSKRPVTFSFNGGPGSSSVWLHLGVLGPRRVYNLDDGSMPPPPFKLVDNEYSLLDKTDLVFIDPVSTGFSRVVEARRPTGSTRSARTSNRWAISSGSTPRATSAGLHQSS